MREFAPEAHPVIVGDRKHDIAPPTSTTSAPSAFYGASGTPLSRAYEEAEVLDRWERVVVVVQEPTPLLVLR
jgi:hypothetical protein